MGLLIAQINTAYDTLLPRDRMVNVVWFDKNTPGIISTLDADALASDLANLWKARLDTTEVNVRIYDADDPKPRPIKGQSTKNAGLVVSYGKPRENCLCLSFYSDRNIPHRRGRLYVPVPQGAQGASVIRPTLAQRTSLLDLASGLAGLGGADIDWVVHSPTLQEHYNVSHAWVDDEWDTMRSRGLKATTRETRAVGP